MSGFKITGPGLYRTRCGFQAVITSPASGMAKYGWHGYVKELPGHRYSWCDRGECGEGDTDNYPFDIVGPWVETPRPRGQMGVITEDGTIQPVVSLRDEMAMAALTGLLAYDAAAWAADVTKSLPACCYALADQMLAERQKGGAV